MLCIKALLGAEKIQEQKAKHNTDDRMERRQDKIEAIDKELAELEVKEKNLPHDYLADDYSRDLHEYIRKLIAENTTLDKENKRLQKTIYELHKMLAAAVGNHTVVISSRMLQEDCPRFVLGENMCGDLLAKTKKGY